MELALSISVLVTIAVLCASLVLALLCVIRMAKLYQNSNEKMARQLSFPNELWLAAQSEAPGSEYFSKVMGTAYSSGRRPVQPQKDEEVGRQMANAIRPVPEPGNLENFEETLLEPADGH